MIKLPFQGGLRDVRIIPEALLRAEVKSPFRAKKDLVLMWVLGLMAFMSIC